MAREFELNPVTFITVGTIGPPGQRVFHLQAGTEDELVTLIIEKEQTRALAEAVSQLLEEIAEQLELAPADPKAGQMDTDLHEPILPAFQVGRMGVAFDEETSMVVVVAQELLPEDADEEASVARFYATRDQMLVLSEYALEVVEQGRPICPLCGQPEDPEGHFCPKRNGHGEHVLLA